MHEKPKIALHVGLHGSTQVLVELGDLSEQLKSQYTFCIQKLWETAPHEKLVISPGSDHTTGTKSEETKDLSNDSRMTLMTALVGLYTNGPLLVTHSSSLNVP